MSCYRLVIAVIALPLLTCVFSC